MSDVKDLYENTIFLDGDTVEIKDIYKYKTEGKKIAIIFPGFEKDLDRTSILVKFQADVILCKQPDGTYRITKNRYATYTEEKEKAYVS